MAKQHPRSVSGNAVAFAKRYVELTEALMREGVEEVTARKEAVTAATTLLMEKVSEPTYDPVQGPCPTCGRG